MTRDYNRKNPKEYRLSNSIYREVISIVRNYDYYYDLYNDAIQGGAVVADGMPGGNKIGRPTEARTIAAERYKEKIDAIEHSISAVPPMYRTHVWENCVHGYSFPEGVRRSCGRYKQIYLYKVAESLYLV